MFFFLNKEQNIFHALVVTLKHISYTRIITRSLRRLKALLQINNFS